MVLLFQCLPEYGGLYFFLPRVGISERVGPPPQASYSHKTRSLVYPQLCRLGLRQFCFLVAIDVLVVPWSSPTLFMVEVDCTPIFCWRTPTSSRGPASFCRSFLPPEPSLVLFFSVLHLSGARLSSKRFALLPQGGSPRPTDVETGSLSPLF